MRADVVRLYYDRLRRKIERAGVPYRSSETAGEFIKRAAAVLPAKRKELAMMAGDYECLRYGNDQREWRLERYKQAVRRFRTR